MVGLKTAGAHHFLFSVQFLGFVYAFGEDSKYTPQLFISFPVLLAYYDSVWYRVLGLAFCHAAICCYSIVFGYSPAVL